MEQKSDAGDLEDYEICENDSTRTAVMESPQSPFWIQSEDVNLKHRIGRGTFGDTWLATLHSFNQEFDEFHEVAAKTLSFVDDDQDANLQPKLYYIFQRCQSLQRVSWPRGICKKNDKICIITKFYEGSIGDKMAHLKENKLPLEDVLRYGLDLALAVSELHSVRLMALNLKPCNFLLDDQDKVILGEFGIPSLLLGMPFSNPEKALWLGTPNYMAPEQWSPDVRGPLSFATDSWGFACSMIELFTGEKPWQGCTPEEIFSHVVMKREKPKIPSGLPLGISNILRSCFDYDYRNRPSFDEIVRAFESPEIPYKEGDWVYVKDGSNGKPGVVKSVMGADTVVLQYFDKKNELVNCDGISKMSFWKHSFQVGEVVHLKESPVLRDGTDVHELIRTEGMIMAIDKRAGTILVKFSESQEPVHVSPATIERVCSGFVVGDLVRLREGWPLESSSPSSMRPPSSIGLVHGFEPNGSLKVAFLGREMLWICGPRELEKVKPFCIGQFVRVKKEVVSPRFQWPLRKDRCWDTGRISRIGPNGGLLVSFPGRLWNWDEWWADPEELEAVRMQDYDNWFDKYHHLEAMHWCVRPLVITILSTVAMRLGAGLVCALPLPRKGKKKESKEEQGGKMEQAGEVQGQGKDSVSGSASWLPPSVASIIFRENGTTSP